ncbi:ABC transporter permease [Pseudidiomarina sp. 1APP75-27a]|uniref:ABC transporter permease n=1 Tax=Pseudidiomarina terrestris TaxID=2820060 RepID=UPI002B05BA83|nr:ABC transporter permease [Pseudidiomarina sp. 1APP75-27a]MEA3588431.1 ABC transporter permease [Pseudidiomarina sp. 1APP75-27a]
MKKLIHGIYEGGTSAVQSIFAHSFRSALTTLGIIIGVSAVIAVVSIMEGLGTTVGKQLQDLGAEMVTLKAHTSTEKEMLGMTSKITYEDYLYLKAKTKNIKYMTAKVRAFSLGSDIRFGQKSITTQIIGTESEYQNVVNVLPSKGRFLSDNDDLNRRRVVFLGHSLLKKLDLPDNPAGKFVKLFGEWFRVIGLAEAKGSLLGFDQDNYVIAPLSTIESISGQRGSLGVDILFVAADSIAQTDVIVQMTQLLRNKYMIERPADDFFEFETAEKTRSQFKDITDSITLVAVGVVGISLLVGGIGIMNIMLVSVTERTREIGIAKALGATSKIILIQFLVEACILALFGGGVGVLIGYIFAFFVTMMLPVVSAAIVPLWAIGLALGFSLTIGIVFGIAPAIKASSLDPIDALRYE